MASKISVSLGAKRKGPPPTNGVKRPHSTLQDEEDAGVEFGAAEKVSHFDRAAGGAIDESRKKEETGPLVIPRMSNRDWKEAANQRKRQKSGLPSKENDVNMEQRMREVEAADAAKKPQFGLNKYKKMEENGEDAETTNGHATFGNGDEAHANGNAVPEPHQRKTDDELALDALLGKSSTNKTLTIPAAEGTMTESDAFQHDYADAPPAATLDDYARVPVEQFGAALLRGMGWKDGEGIGSQKGKKLPKDLNKLPERRANLLGIGAKEDAALAQEMGAWGKGARGKEVKIYNPVLLRDKKTGKMYTEEEAQKKREDDERRKYEDEFEQKERDKERRRRRDDSEERDSGDRRRAKDMHSGRGDDRRRDRDYDRRRHGDDESEEEYRRRKEKERRRRKERERDDRDDDYDRERSRRHRDRHHDDDRDQRRDRNRDRRR